MLHQLINQPIGQQIVQPLLIGLPIVQQRVIGQPIVHTVVQPIDQSTQAVSLLWQPSNLLGGYDQCHAVHYRR